MEISILVLCFVLLYMIIFCPEIFDKENIMGSNSRCPECGYELELNTNCKYVCYNPKCTQYYAKRK